jgi:hypothetical protein
MEESINDRIELLINQRFNGNKASFAKSIGLLPTGLSNYLGKQRRSKPSVDMVAKIILSLDVDARWLLLGDTPTQEGVHVEAHGYAQSAGRDINNGPDYAQTLQLKERVSHLEQRLRDKDATIAEKERLIQVLMKK